MQLRVAALPEGGTVPKAHTADGADQSPALSWGDAPKGTQAFALVLDDPDAPVGLWTHWVLYNLPAACAGLPAGLPKSPTLPDGSRQGRNTWGRIGFNGPAPPPGKPHRYVFHLYALREALELPAGASRAEVDAALKGRILAEATCTGLYGR